MNHTPSFRQAALELAVHSSNADDGKTMSLAKTYFEFLSQADPRVDQMMTALKQIVVIAASDPTEFTDPMVDMAKIAQKTIEAVEDETSA
jgi:hypothetical protein